MATTYCKDCKHFVGWGTNNASYDQHPEGVCTAPRPDLGLTPNREVRRYGGENCRTFKKDTHND